MFSHEFSLCHVKLRSVTRFYANSRWTKHTNEVQISRSLVFARKSTSLRVFTCVMSREFMRFHVKLHYLNHLRRRRFAETLCSHTTRRHTRREGTWNHVPMMRMQLNPFYFVSQTISLVITAPRWLSTASLVELWPPQSLVPAFIGFSFFSTSRDGIISIPANPPRPVRRIRFSSISAKPILRYVT